MLLMLSFISLLAIVNNSCTGKSLARYSLSNDTDLSLLFHKPTIDKVPFAVKIGVQEP